jgi:hypothetical protein
MSDKDAKFKKDIEKLLNPGIIKKNLIRSSLYLTAFELLKYAVEQRIKSFLCIGQEMDENFEYLNCQNYKDKIVNRIIPQLNNNKNVYYSSCLWLKEADAITEYEVEELQKIRLHRNKIGHEMPKLMIDSDHEINLDLFESIKRLLTKIEQWWIVEFEMPTNPDYDNFDYDSLDMNEVNSGNMILLNHLIDIVKNEMKNENHS